MRLSELEKGRMQRRMKGEALRQLREEKGLTQDALGNAADISSKSLSNYESGKASPGLNAFLSIIDVLKPSIDKLIDLLSLDYLKNTEVKKGQRIDVGTPNQPSYMDYVQRLLKRFEGMKYYCFYQTTEEDPLQTLVFTDSLSYSVGGYLQAPVEVRGRAYRCRATCTYDQRYTFFDFESQDINVGDRILYVLPYMNKVKSKYHAGIGTLAGISYPSGDNMMHPCFEMMAIVSTEFISMIGQQVLKTDSADKREVFQVGMDTVRGALRSKRWLELPSYFNDDYLLIIQQNVLEERSNAFYHDLLNCASGDSSLHNQHSASSNV